ncbi:DUF4351 domain-containing protein [Haliangium sp.]|uniref:DUF4351 domain-containing protein n=1 Tax=Haliangium sp. TaxID=2663208 RepID=UPI003D0A6126
MIFEVQLARDPKKRASWLNYVGTLHRAIMQPVTLVVLTLSDDLAAWCAEPYVYDHVGGNHRPVVLGPSGIPRVTDIDQARAMPALAVLSAVAHGAEAGAEGIGIAAYLACGALDKERGARYADVVMSCLHGAARRAVEEYLDMQGYPFLSEFAQTYAEAGHKQGLEEGQKEGRKEGQQELLLRLLGRKFGELAPAIEQRVRAADLDDLERWAERVLVATTLADVFDEPGPNGAG